MEKSFCTVGRMRQPGATANPNPGYGALPLAGDPTAHALRQVLAATITAYADGRRVSGSASVHHDEPVVCASSPVPGIHRCSGVHARLRGVCAATRIEPEAIPSHGLDRR